MTAALILLALAADLSFPSGYREWVFLSSGLGMTYGTPNANAKPRFTNVFVNPEAWKHFEAKGTWPEGATFILEIRESATEGSINKGGQYQTAISAIEVSRKSGGEWTFYDFGKPSKTSTAAPLAKTERCYQCHSANGAVEWTFVQFYPAALEIAKAKGTLRSGASASGGGH